ncbi:MAG: terpene cyclase/mutase family protein [Planctomycetota bacterium]|nr:terpene cyclase/mutase family protein [Planctomycetota bacterium]
MYIDSRIDGFTLRRWMLFGIATAFSLIVMVPGDQSLAQIRFPNAERTVESSGIEHIDAQTQTAIDRGLAYLASRQNLDGSFGRGGPYQSNVAVTALAGMAFMSAGHTPGRGTYGSNVQRAVDFILDQTQANGFIVSPGPATHGPMYGHGFATLFLAEVYGMTPPFRNARVSVGEALDQAVKVIINSQNKDGGWRYHPEPNEADVSVTVCQVMALRAARNAGILVRKDVIDFCTDYVKKCQNSDGGFRYQLRSRRDSMFPRTAASVVALYSAGIYDGPEVNNALKYLLARKPGRPASRFETHYFYAHYYAVQAMWHSGGRNWDLWFPAIRDELVLRQSRRDGSWAASYINSEYSTAMACLVLQMPNNYLPIFQR